MDEVVDCHVAGVGAELIVEVAQSEHHLFARILVGDDDLGDARVDRRQGVTLGVAIETGNVLGLASGEAPPHRLAEAIDAAREIVEEVVFGVDDGEADS